MLRLERVSKSFSTSAFGRGALPAVRDVSFEIEAGEVTSLIGESGSGKSTLGKMILHLLPVTSGSISFEGSDIVGLRGKALKEYYRKVQGVFQDPFSSYNPIFRADRVFAIVRKEYFPHAGATEWSAKVNSSLEAVGLNPADVLNKFTHELSGGQLQRLLIARALLLDIRLLVADEIISMLDASTRVDVLNLLGELKAKGLGILFITHDLSLGNYISERTIILRRGIVLEMGATEKVFDHPQHPYTKMLLASVPQLHRKWDSASDIVASPADGSVRAGTPATSPAGSEPFQQATVDGRYSRSLAHPLRNKLGTRGQPDGESDDEEERRRSKNDAYLRAHEDVPPLLEVEPDHFVAAAPGE